MGVKGALATPPVFGVLGTLAVFFALRRLFGPAPALLGGAAAGAERGAGLVRALPRLGDDVAVPALPRPAGVRATGRSAARRAFGALAGAALGLSLLVRIDSALLAGAARVSTCSCGARAATCPGGRRCRFLAPLRASSPCTPRVHAAFWARKYVLDIATRPLLEPARRGLAAGARSLVARPCSWPSIAASAAAASRLLDAHGAAAAARRCWRRSWSWRSYAYLLRPVALGLGRRRRQRPGARPARRDPGARCCAPRASAAWPRTTRSRFVRLGWFVTPLGLGLGVLGLLRGARATGGRATCCPCSSASTFARLLPLQDPRLERLLLRAAPLRARDRCRCCWASRPSCSCAWPRAGGWRRAAGRRAGAGPRRRSYAATRRASRATWTGGARCGFVADVARRFGPEDVVIFEQPRSIHLLSLPLWAVHGVNALELARFNPDPDAAAAPRRRLARRATATSTSSTPTAPTCAACSCSGWRPTRFGTFEWERAYDRKPRGRPSSARCTSRSRAWCRPRSCQVPAARRGGRRRHRTTSRSPASSTRRAAAERTFRWTGPCASVYLPGARPGASARAHGVGGAAPGDQPGRGDGLALRARAGRVRGRSGLDRARPAPARPPARRARRCCVSTCRAWRPGQRDPRLARTTRDLGVMVDRIRVDPPGPC